jgi:hypothetical protein
MNELIKELANQADQYANQQNELYGVDFKTEYDQKFAELIVKEVTNIVLHFTDVDEGVAVAKKHFGVE